MFGLAQYWRTQTGQLLGELLRRTYAYLGRSAKEAAGRTDKAQWSRMLHGETALDLNKLFEELDLETFSRFMAAVMAAKVEHERNKQRERVA